MITVWRGSDGDDAPVEMQCKVFGFPNRTSSGEQMYQNTHFRTEAEAWQSILRSAKAGLSLSNSRLESCRVVLAEAERDMVERGARLARVLENIPKEIEP
jgi:hypothetical protein